MLTTSVKVTISVKSCHVSQVTITSVTSQSRHSDIPTHADYPRTLPGGQSRSARAAATMASSHSTGVRLPRLSANIGVTSRCRLRPSHANRDLSDSHSSLISYEAIISELLTGFSRFSVTICTHII